MKRILLLATVCIGLVSQTFAQRYLQSNFFTQVKVTKNVVYAQNFNVLTGTPTLIPLVMDVYEPMNDQQGFKRPVVVYIHTGSFLPRYINGTPTGAKSDSAVVEMCTQFAKRGYVAVAMSYRSGWNPTALGPTGQDIRTGTLLNAVYRAIQDAKACVRYLRKDAGTANTFSIDTNKIALGGQGSGGYVALAYATLDKVGEINLPKFLSSTDNATYGFVTGQSYINQAALGDFEGRGGIPQLNSATTVNLGYSSKVNYVFNIGGALGDSSWMEAGDVPMSAVHVKTDPFAPYKYGQVIVPTTGDFVVNVSGSFDAMQRANNLGNNSILNSQTFSDPYSVRASLVNEGNKNVFPIIFPSTQQQQQAGPWEWWNQDSVKALQPSAATGGNSGLALNANGLATNPDMSKAKAIAYIDTIQGYLNPRIVVAMGLTTVGVNTLSKEFVSIYPNPASDRIVIDIPTLNNSSYNVSVLDAMGRVMFEEKNVNEATKIIETNSLSNGFYFVRISNGTDMRVEKIIINK